MIAPMQPAMARQHARRDALAAILVGAAMMLAFVMSMTQMAGSAAAQDRDPAYQEFYAALDPHGAWVEHPRYGDTWVPYANEDRDWRPYSRGQWVFTEEHGWYWESEEEFGWVVYHYGRWLLDDRHGWMWVPGRDWAPAWVAWREGEEAIGWAPLPPEAELGPNGELAYEAYASPRHAPMWMFVAPALMTMPFVYRHFYPRQRSAVFFGQTRHATHYGYRGGHVYNRGIDRRFIEHRAQRPVPVLQVRPMQGPREPGQRDFGQRGPGRGFDDGRRDVGVYRPSFGRPPAGGDRGVPGAGAGRPVQGGPGAGGPGAPDGFGRRGDGMPPRGQPVGVPPTTGGGGDPSRQRPFFGPDGGQRPIPAPQQQPPQQRPPQQEPVQGVPPGFGVDRPRPPGFPQAQPSLPQQPGPSGSGGSRPDWNRPTGGMPGPQGPVVRPAPTPSVGTPSGPPQDFGGGRPPAPPVMQAPIPQPRPQVQAPVQQPRPPVAQPQGQPQPQPPPQRPQQRPDRPADGRGAPPVPPR